MDLFVPMKVGILIAKTMFENLIFPTLRHSIYQISILVP